MKMGRDLVTKRFASLRLVQIYKKDMKVYIHIE